MSYTIFERLKISVKLPGTKTLSEDFGATETGDMLGKKDRQAASKASSR